MLIPVDPKMDAQLRLASLLRYAQDAPDRAKVLPLPNELTAQDTTFEETLFVATVETATKLNVAGAFQFSADTLHEVGVCDMKYGVLHSYPSGALPSDSLARGAFWGSSLRMTLKTSVGNLDAGASLGAVAARAQAGLSAIEYELTVVGDIASSLEFFAAALDGLPIMGTFDYEAYAYFKSRQKALRRLFIALAPQRPTTVIAAELAGKLEPTAYKKTMSMHYAMRCILDGLLVGAAVARAPDSVESAIVTATYAKLGIKGAPTNDHKEMAGGWLYA